MRAAVVDLDAVSPRTGEYLGGASLGLGGGCCSVLGPVNASLPPTQSDSQLQTRLTPAVEAAFFKAVWSRADPPK